MAFLLRRRPATRVPPPGRLVGRNALASGLRAFYILREGYPWYVNLVTGEIGGTVAGSGVEWHEGLMRTPGSAGNGVLLSTGSASNATPLSFVYGLRHGSGVVDWSLMADEFTWTGWYHEGDALKSTNANSFDGTITFGGALLDGVYRYAASMRAANELYGRSWGGTRTEDATSSAPAAFARDVALGWSRRSIDDNAALAYFDYFGVFGRDLTPGEQDDLTDCPWIVFDERIWVPVSAGGGAAALEGAATVSASAAGALTTQIPLTGAAVLQATAAGSLTTAVQLAGAALAAGQAVGDLSTAISLTGAAASVTTAAGGLTTQIRLDGAGLAAALASGTLAGGTAALAGDAQAGAQATGGITTLIVLQGAAVGAALAAADLTAPGSGLAGAATAGAVASGALTTQIPLGGGATVSVIAAGDVTTTVSLAGAAVGVVSATGDLVVALALDGAAVAAALAGASLTTAIVMEGAAVVGAQASGTLDGTEVIPIAAGCPPSAPKPTRRRIILEGKVYEVAPRDVPALLKAHLLKRRPPRSVVQVESPVPAPEPAQDAPEEAVEAQSAEPALDAVALLQARADAMLAELRRQAAADVERALLRVLQRQIEQLIDEEEAATLLLMH